MTPLEQIGNDKLVETIAKNMRVDADYYNDLCQEVYYILLTGYTEEKLQEAINKKQINFIITCILKNQWFSATSPFYRQYKKPNLKKVPMEQYKEENDEE
jgi:hypothetical protein